MHALTEDAADSWLTSRGYPNLFDLHRMSKGELYALPQNLEKRIVLAGVLAKTVFGETENLLVVEEIGIWLSAENRFIFRKFLESGGISTEGLTDVDWPEPVRVLCSRSDFQYLNGLFELAIQYVYGGFVARGDGRFICWFSHDELIKGYSDDEAIMADFRSAVERWSKSGFV